MAGLPAIRRGDVVSTPLRRDARVVAFSRERVRLRYLDNHEEVLLQRSLCVFVRRPDAPETQRAFVLQTLSTPSTCSEIVAVTGLPEGSVRAHLSILVTRGFVVHGGRKPKPQRTRGAPEILYRLK